MTAMPLLERIVLWLVTGSLVFLAMDLWAAFLHGRVWHGALWGVHRTHHSRRAGRFELNDALSGLHAPVAVAAILYGCRAAPGPLREIVFATGVGMTAFGLAYVVVHDGLVHGRLPVRRLARVPYLRRVVEAHRVHHANRHGGPPYGLFFGPWELAHARALTRRSASATSPAPPPRSTAPR